MYGGARRDGTSRSKELCSACASLLLSFKLAEPPLLLGGASSILIATSVSLHLPR